MTDLLQVVPDFNTRPYSELLHALDKAAITTSDLLTLEPSDVGKRAQRAAGEVKKFVDALATELHRHLGFGAEEATRSSTTYLDTEEGPRNDDTKSRTISTLDDKLDAALGGGIPQGYLVEVTGESGAGKTQLLLTLLLASQLPPPLGLSKSAIYISTEAALATNRLVQLLSTHPALASLDNKHRPSLSRILSIQTPDLESQEHILRYQLPVAIRQHQVGLVILDSVAANYRAEFEKQGVRDGAASMAKRGAQLVQLGALFRDLARTEGVTIVVANQVADRFTKDPGYSSNMASRTTSGNSQGTASGHGSPMHALPASQTGEGTSMSTQVLSLDHQQRWTTGWGEDQFASPHALKTPSLGLVWTNQLACRIALIKQPVFATQPPVVTIDGVNQFNDQESHISKWRRWFKVVFAPWAPPTEGRGIEYEVLKSGIRHVSKDS